MKTSKVLVTDLKVGDSYFLYGVEMVISEINPKTDFPVDENEILFRSNNLYRGFSKTRQTRAIVR
tara:strand:+ start:648 stop:842 length:195 start_codon:yes stop_codon:yes gene_type:complete